jgi:hypothetical protein
MTSPRDPVQQAPERGIGGGRRPSASAPVPPDIGRALVLVALLSGLALVVAGAALFVALTRPGPAPAAAPTATPIGAVPSDAGASNVPEPTPTDSHEFPSLEAILPKTVDGTALSVLSTTGTETLSGDPTYEGLFQWLTASGRKTDEIEFAEAYDPTSTVDVDLIALRVKGIPTAQLRQELLKSWLAADPSAITTTNKTIGGKAVVAMDYVDPAYADYVFEQGDAVVVLTTSDPAVAERVVSSLK